MVKIIEFHKVKKTKDLADELCELYKKMGVFLSEEDKTRIRETLSSEKFRDVLAVGGNFYSVSLEEMQ